MNTLFSTFLPFVFNSQRAGRAGDLPEYAATYGRFKPTYFVFFRRPSNDDAAQQLYNHIRTVAWYLDAIPYLSQAGLPFRIGIDDIISAIPFYGDFIGLGLALYQVFLCWVFGVPQSVLVRMILYVFADLVLGIVPLLGDVLDTLFKANLRNLALLEDWLLKDQQRYNIEVTPSDNFLPRKRAASGARAGASNGTARTTGRDKYRTGPTRAGSQRFEDLD